MVNFKFKTRGNSTPQGKPRPIHAQNRNGRACISRRTGMLIRKGRQQKRLKNTLIHAKL